MATYRRRGHYRRSSTGSPVWVREHTVSRRSSPLGGQARPLERVRVSAPVGWVQPNATCPVCGAVVFFYANEYGSRVYFDELGPPWLKHPCTSQDKFSRVAVPGPIVPTVKSDGGGARVIASTERGRPLVVSLVVRSRAAGVLLHLRSLQPGGQTKVWRSAENLRVSPGQIVFLSADVMSYIDMRTMEPASAHLRYHSSPSLLERVLGRLGR